MPPGRGASYDELTVKLVDYAAQRPDEVLEDSMSLPLDEARRSDWAMSSSASIGIDAPLESPGLRASPANSLLASKVVYCLWLNTASRALSQAVNGLAHSSPSSPKALQPLASMRLCVPNPCRWLLRVRRRCPTTAPSAT